MIYAYFLKPAYNCKKRRTSVSKIYKALVKQILTLVFVSTNTKRPIQDDSEPFVSQSTHCGPSSIEGKLPLGVQSLRPWTFPSQKIRWSSWYMVYDAMQQRYTHKCKDLTRVECSSHSVQLKRNTIQFNATLLHVG